MRTIRKWRRERHRGQPAFMLAIKASDQKRLLSKQARAKLRSLPNSKRSAWHSTAAAGLILAAVAGLSGNVSAMPSGGQVVNGSGTISQNGATMTVTQATDKLALNWNTFNIAGGEKVHFVQPGVNSVALNRVIGSGRSQIYGQLTANGKVFLSNPNGVLFAPGAEVNVGGLVATSLKINDSDFMSGKYIFSKDGTAGAVINQGAITAAVGSYVALLGPAASNEGVIVANQGTIALAAGDKITLGLQGDSLINIAVDQGAVNAQAANANLIQANGGMVIMTAKAADHLTASAVNNSGVVEAKALTTTGGVIRLEGSNVDNSGTLDASGRLAGQSGGTVTVLGDNVALTKNALLDVSGDQGGGVALVGGNFQGQGPQLNARTTSVGPQAVIKADALHAGDGGKVAVWADETTDFAGTISARGGKLSGDGGEVEVSGKQRLHYNGLVDLQAGNGQTGSLLLDPNDFTIAASGGDISGSTLSANLIGANVTILSSDGGTDGNGDIFVNDAVSWSSGRSLVLNAYRNIAVNANITASGDGANIKLFAGSSGNGSGTVTFGDGIKLTAKNASTGGYVKIMYNPPGGYSIPTNYANNMSACSGHADAYMLINSFTDLANIDDQMAYWFNNYALSQSIDALDSKTMHGGAGWTPIGYNSVGSEFAKKFDGQGFTIDHLYINYTPASLNPPPNPKGYGFFGCISSAGSVENLGLTNVDIYCGTTNDNTGALVGDNFGLINNCYSTGKVKGTYSTGGLAGASCGIVTNSYSTASVETNLGHSGGLLGTNDGTVKNSYSTGTVNNTTPSNSSQFQYSYAGGLVGMNQNQGSIELCYSTGNVTGGYGAAGLVGVNDRGTITKSYSSGSVSGGYMYNGGLVAYNGGFFGNTGGTISLCYTTSNVTGNLGNGGNVLPITGGFVAYNTGNISNSYCSGTVNEGQYVGGFVGEHTTTGSITNCYSVSSVTGSNYVDGFACNDDNIRDSSDNSTISGCFWDNDSTKVPAPFVTDYSNGTGITDSGMRTAGTFDPEHAAWSTTNWKIVDGAYPVLKWTLPSTITFNGILSSHVSGAPIDLIYGGQQIISATTGSGGTFTLTVDPAVVGTDCFLIYLGGATGSNETATLVNKDAAAGSFDLTVGRLTAVGGSTAGLISAKGNLANNLGIPYLCIDNNITLTSGVSLYTSGNFIIGGNITTTNAGQVYGGPVTVNAGSVLASLNSGNISFNGSLSASAGLLVNAAGNITIASGQSLHSSVNTGNPLVLVAGGNFINNNSAANALAVASGGYWRVYSSSPTGDTVGNLSYAFKEYGKSYGQGLSGSGNGLIYSYSPAPLTMSLTGTVSKTYDGTDTATPATANFTAGGLQTGDSLSNMTYSSATYDDRNVNNGKTVSVSGLSPTFASGSATVYGYTLSNSNVSDTVGQINKKAITITPDAGQTSVYDGNVPGASITYTHSALATGDTFTGALSVSGASRNVGSYNITQGTLTVSDGNSGNNYDITVAAGRTFSITAKSITITPDAGQSMVYDGNIPSPALTYTNTGLGTGDSFNGSLGLANPSRNVGNYAITPGNLTIHDGNGGNNYSVTFIDGVQYAVTAKPLTITPDSDQGMTYNGSVPSPTLTYHHSGLGNSDSFSGTLALTNPSRNVGNYGINQGSLAVSDGNDGNNYAITFNGGVTYGITPATLIYTAAQTSKVYGDANPSLAGSVTGFVGSDNLANATSGTAIFTTAATQTSNVGSYAITGGGLLANNGNYVFTQHAGNAGALTITRAPLTITAGDASRIYGGVNPTFTASYSGFKNNDNSSVLSGLALTTTANQASNVGAYTIMPRSAVATNYDISYTNGTLTITKAPLLITADDTIRTYGDVNPTFTVRCYNGFKNNDSSSVLSGLAWTTTANQASNVGNYAITPSGAVATNYDISYTNGTLRIMPAVLTYVATAASRNVGEPNPPFTGTVTGFKLVDTLSNATTGSLIFTTTATTSSRSGQYDITGSGLIAKYGNYLFVQHESNCQALTINSQNQPMQSAITTVQTTNTTATSNSGINSNFGTTSSVTVTSSNTSPLLIGTEGSGINISPATVLSGNGGALSGPTAGVGTGGMILGGATTSATTSGGMGSTGGLVPEIKPIPTGQFTSSASGSFQVAVASFPIGQADVLVVNRPIANQSISSSGMITVPHDTFASTNANAQITLTATQINGNPLPGWVHFDPTSGQLSVQPPSGFIGQLDIKLIARDNQGHEAVSTFKVDIGHDLSLAKRW